MRKLARLLAGAAVAGLMVGGAVSPATAASGNKLVVSQNAAGTITIVQGSTLQAGLIVEAEVSSTYSVADPEIFQLRNGVTLAQMDTKIAEAGQGGAVAAAAMQWFTANTTFYGGLSATGSVKFDLIMPVGTYYVAQLRPVGNVKPSTTAKQFKVIGSPQAIQPYAGQKLTVVNTSGPDNFSAFSVAYGTGKLHNGPITITNKTGSISSPRELHFFQFTQVQPGTTAAQVNAWLAGGPSPVVPGGSAQNFGTQSTQRAIHAHLNLALGRYLVASWIPDTNSGTPHILEGEFLLVDVVA